MTVTEGRTHTYITYDTVDDGRIARIMLDRPAARNAQNRGLLVELGDALASNAASSTSAR